MSTFSHSLSPVHARRLALVSTVSTPQSVEKRETIPADDGLGCIRGLVVALLFNIFLATVFVCSWEVWHYLHVR
ncbi:hypothetical protein [Acidobacterium sp. S8]|uniref:hypothetical protein n=1 Tax=Acidobacterium sp. S8 TaxID=1641854 RepID=UPI00131ACE3F|nr:hypothetical protein [Acidobacterium sp. S8]